MQIRDMVAYLVACAVTLELLWDGHFSAREAGLLIVLYAAYLLICIGTSRCVLTREGAVPCDQPTRDQGSGHESGRVARKCACMHCQSRVRA